LMSVLVECCKQQRGGALVSTIYKYTYNGDPFIQNFINNILEEVSKPFFEMRIYGRLNIRYLKICNQHLSAHYLQK
ncbi:2328_t:CDS:2, partial [Entrophospora sp. SA101]